MPVPELRFEGKRKFVWDGEVYPIREAAEARRREYEGQGFEVRLEEAEGGWVLYTRREAGTAPPA